MKSALTSHHRLAPQPSSGALAPLAAVLSPGLPPASEALIGDRSGELHVFLDAGGDHIVTKFIVNRRGEPFETTLPYGSWAWERAVRRAQRAVVFL